ncbi:MAG: FG-GAP-like repeat-containing protein [Saprospiraceae bacterium]
MKSKIWVILFLSYAAQAQIKFSNLTSDLIPANHFSGSVIGIADMNADGLADIIRLERANELSIAYQSSPGKPFVIKKLGVIAPYEFWNVAIADVNGDGWNDMVFSANENKAYIYYSQVVGLDVQYLKQALDSSETVYAQAGNLVDINRDGWLDYFVCNDLAKNKIWANNKLGQITNSPVPWIDFTTAVPSDNSGNYGSSWNDFDNDGDVDLYIAKCKAGASLSTDPRRINTYFKNNGNNTFSEIAADIGLASGAQSWVAVSGDCDNDGDLDIFIVNHLSPCQLMINDGTGHFTNQIAASGITYNQIGVQAAWVDFDNDGKLDLIISGSNHQIYRNLGANKFELLDGKELGIFQMESIAVGDLNNDGKQDIYASYSLVFNEASHRSDAIWMNNTTNGNHFIKVRLEGSAGNRAGIGARISIYINGSPQIREIQSGSSYGIQHELTQHFGIGSSTKIDSIVIRWPDGLKEVFESPFIDRTMVIQKNKCFAFDPVIKPNPALSVLCKTGDSVRVNVPLSGTYLWTNGSTERDIIIKETGNFQVKVIDINGCIVHSNMVAIQHNPNTRYKINAGDTLICSNDQTSLNIQSPYTLVWNTGDTAHTISINKEGNYFATTNNECGISNSDTVFIRAINVSNISVKNDTVVLALKAILRAVGTNIFWFAEGQGGAPIASGPSYQTPPIFKTTTFYVQSIITSSKNQFSGGIKDFNSTSKFNADNFSGKLFFDVTQPIILKSVKVYSDTAATREIILLNSSGVILFSKLIRIEKGETRINLDFSIAPGESYALTTNDETSVKIFGGKSPRLYRTEGSVPYPLIAGPVSIYGTNAGPANYYYFYDWQLGYPDLVCMSERIPVQAVLKTVSIKNEIVNDVKIFPNPVTAACYLEWSDQLINKPFSWEITDLSGKTILRKRSIIITKQMRINLDECVAGIYILRLQSGEKQGVFKIVKAR